MQQESPIIPTLNMEQSLSQCFSDSSPLSTSNSLLFSAQHYDELKLLDLNQKESGLKHSVSFSSFEQFRFDENSPPKTKRYSSTPEKGRGKRKKIKS
jgi:hypothetical protein